MAPDAIAFETSELTIETTAGAHRFVVEIADAADERARGLMYREKLPADAGMLFIYPSPQLVTMWMKNTLIPLDMIFIGDDGRIVSIAERTVPRSTATVSSVQRARGVLELNGGTAARLAIGPGDLVRHPAFGTAE